MKRNLVPRNALILTCTDDHQKMVDELLFRSNRASITSKQNIKMRVKTNSDSERSCQSKIYDMKQSFCFYLLQNVGRSSNLEVLPQRFQTTCHEKVGFWWQFYVLSSKYQ